MSLLKSISVGEEVKIRVFITGFIQDILGDFYSGFRFSITAAVIRRGLDKVETVILGESRMLLAIKLRPIVTNAQIRDAMASKISLNSLCNGAGCGTPYRASSK